ncbi:MAG: SDR family oxidoreductase, partial [Microlunatus sp.]|nr:SDR family oxidoreductase [Microlunatus sp.]
MPRRRPARRRARLSSEPAARPGEAYRQDLFAGRRVIVTGGTSGIGLAVAEAFAELGAEVLAAGLGSVSVRGPAAGLTVTELDVTDGEAVAELLAGTEPLDALVNCAGVIRRDEEFAPEVFADVLDVNLTGTMRCCVAALPALRAARGCVINTASM